MRDWLTPLDCHEVSGLLDGYIRGTLDSQRSGRVSAHLDSCDDCAVAFSQSVAGCMAAGTLPVPDGVRVWSVPKWKIEGRGLLVWGRELIEQATLLTFGYPAALQAARGAGFMLGEPNEEVISFELRDFNLVPVDEPPVKAAVTSAPLVETNGSFSMIVEIEEDAATRYAGFIALCVLRLETEWLGFETSVRGPKIEFRAVNLPPVADEDCILDSGAFEYYLVPDTFGDGT